MFEQLSDRAKAMLTEKERKYIPKKPDEIRQHLIVNNIKPAQAFIDFEANFGGYVFEARHEWYLKLSTYFDTINNIQFVECMVNRVAPFEFEMDETGIIYAADRRIQIPIAASIITFIEYEAVYHYMYSQPNWHHIVQIEPSIQLSEFTDLRRIDIASDVHREWWTNDNMQLLITKWKMWAKNATWEIQAYAQTQEDLQPINHHLK